MPKEYLAFLQSPHMKTLLEKMQILKQNKQELILQEEKPKKIMNLRAEILGIKAVESLVKSEIMKFKKENKDA